MKANQIELKPLLGGFAVAPESTTNVIALENELGVVFPESYKQILALGEELHLGPVEGRNDKDLHFNFHAITTPHFEHVSQTVREAYDELLDDNPKWENIIPIGDTGSGDQVCLDYRHSKDPIVVLYHLENLTCENPFTIEAESIDDLISRASPSSEPHQSR